MLASAMRVASASDSVPKPGEIRKGNTLFSPSAVLRLTPLEPEAYYVLEAYNDGAEESGTMAVEVTDGAGKALIQTANTPVKVAAPAGCCRVGSTSRGCRRAATSSASCCSSAPERWTVQRR